MNDELCTLTDCQITFGHNGDPNLLEDDRCDDLNDDDGEDNVLLHS